MKRSPCFYFALLIGILFSTMIDGTSDTVWGYQPATPRRGKAIAEALFREWGKKHIRLAKGTDNCQVRVFATDENQTTTIQGQRVRLSIGDAELAADQMVIWSPVDPKWGEAGLDLYLEGNVEITAAGEKMELDAVYLDPALKSYKPVRAPARREGELTPETELIRRAVRAKKSVQMQER